jgi:hypothetical protein
MSCESCRHIIGSNYRLTNDSPCHYCGETIYIAGLPATYLGMTSEGFHEYRVHPTQECCGCESKLYLISIPCKDLGFDGEYAQLFKVNENARYR